MKVLLTQLVASDAKLSLLPGQSVLEQWQLTNPSAEELVLKFELNHEIQNEGRVQKLNAQLPLSFKLNDRDLTLGESLELGAIQPGETQELVLETHLNTSVSNSWQNRTWQLEAQIEVSSSSGSDKVDINLEQKGQKGGGQVMGAQIAESIQSQLPKTSISNPVFVEVLLTLFLIIVALGFRLGFRWLLTRRKKRDDSSL